MSVLRKISNYVRGLGFTPRRLSVVVFLVCGFIEAGSVAATAVGLKFGNLEIPTGPVINPPFAALHLDLGRYGPIPPKPPLERLLEAAHRLAIRTSVPYVFGGSQLGHPRVCSQCSECIRTNRLPADSTMDRFNHCAACRDCGLDCSNFVKHLLSEAGLKIKFATTATLNRESIKSLEKTYSLVNIGKDLRDARPGDLVLKKGHVIVLIDIQHQLGTVDFIHASRGSRRTPVGGIELRRGYSLRRIQQETVRILRHRDLLEPMDSTIRLTSVSLLLSDLRRLMAAI